MVSDLLDGMCHHGITIVKTRTKNKTLQTFDRSALPELVTASFLLAGLFACTFGTYSAASNVKCMDAVLLPAMED